MKLMTKCQTNEVKQNISHKIRSGDSRRATNRNCVRHATFVTVPVIEIQLLLKSSM